MKTSRLVLAACGAILGVGLMTPSAKALADNRMTRITFSGPVALPGVTLGAGTYVFELADSSTTRNVVLVRNKDRSQVYFLGLTNRIERPAGERAHTAVIFGEAPAGVPPPIASWYPAQETVGHQFIYPKAMH